MACRDSACGWCINNPIKSLEFSHDALFKALARGINKQNLRPHCPGQFLKQKFLEYEIGVKRCMPSTRTPKI
jgi:hypothetical protein